MLHAGRYWAIDLIGAQPFGFSDNYVSRLYGPKVAKIEEKHGVYSRTDYQSLDQEVGVESDQTQFGSGGTRCEGLGYNIRYGSPR